MTSMLIADADDFQVVHNQNTKTTSTTMMTTMLPTCFYYSDSLDFCSPCQQLCGACNQNIISFVNILFFFNPVIISFSCLVLSSFCLLSWFSLVTVGQNILILSILPLSFPLVIIIFNRYFQSFLCCGSDSQVFCLSLSDDHRTTITPFLMNCGVHFHWFEIIFLPKAIAFPPFVSWFHQHILESSIERPIWHHISRKANVNSWKSQLSDIVRPISQCVSNLRHKWKGKVVNGRMNKKYS